MLSAVLAAAAGAVLAPIASAQAPPADGAAAEASPTDPREQALDLFEEAEQAYQDGRMADAVDLLVRAREIHPEPVLLYNLARAYEALGELDEALAAYRQYLTERPDTEDRGAIETRIAALEAQIAERARLERERRDAETRAERSESRGSVAPALVLLGVGAAALGTGLALGIIASGHRDQADSDPIHASSIETFAQAEDEALAANILFAAGGALATAGLVWLILHLVRDPD